MKRSRSKVRLALTRRAIEDLRQIERHSVKEWGRKVADEYLDDLTAALDRISQSPQLLQDDRVGIPGLSSTVFAGTSLCAISETTPSLSSQ